MGLTTSQPPVIAPRSTKMPQLPLKSSCYSNFTCFSFHNDRIHAKMFLLLSREHFISLDTQRTPSE